MEETNYILAEDNGQVYVFKWGERETWCKMVEYAVEDLKLPYDHEDCSYTWWTAPVNEMRDLALQNVGLSMGYLRKKLSHIFEAREKEAAQVSLNAEVFWADIRQKVEAENAERAKREREKRRAEKAAEERRERQRMISELRKENRKQIRQQMEELKRQLKALP